MESGNSCIWLKRRSQLSKRIQRDFTWQRSLKPHSPIAFARRGRWHDCLVKSLSDGLIGVRRKCQHQRVAPCLWSHTGKSKGQEFFVLAIRHWAMLPHKRCVFVCNPKVQNTLPRLKICFWDWEDSSQELGVLGIIGGPDPVITFLPCLCSVITVSREDQQSTAAFNKCLPVYQFSDKLASLALIINLFHKTQNTRTSDNISGISTTKRQ